MVAEQGVHAICDRFVDDWAEADPVVATTLGLDGRDDRLTDYSPAGHDRRAEIARTALRAIRAARPTDERERIAQAVFDERVGLELELHDAGLTQAALNVIASPVQDIRMVFDLMDTATADDWATVAKRLAAVPATLDGLRQALLSSAQHGRVSALRQLRKTADQADTWAGLHDGKGYFTTFASAADAVPGAPVDEVDRAARSAQRAYAEFAGFLRAELAPHAPVRDAVGEEIYGLWSRYFTGAHLDLREAYAWGWDEFSRIETEMLAVAARIAPGATLAETATALDAHPKYRVRGRAAFEDWMQGLSDHALDSLRGKHFDIPDALMTLECSIAPPGGGVGAYYTGPSADFGRPGRMWWSVPADKEEFSTWREVSVVYHEGVPGHHLQVATAVHEAETLNKYQRMMSFTDGHGEGWALYAERLMAELGYIGDDGDLFGMLSELLFRAARVVVDIGMHLELEIPAGTGFHVGERWTPGLGLEFLLSRTVTDRDHVRDEIDRYLGWPGQAPAYKLGERLWLTARDEARARAGNSFDLKDFHTRALKMGGMGLDTLRAQLAAMG
ncbi:uncharacterized protein (DUF885 family) [Nocardia transvalensis]|uniref:Uncharacterized protein (DUF885 family) n=1 Tax=Nocardia transvalensis TaxID=37333 RepID=A0A7W9PM12_9NOCA|nr:DUF885 domain-containing protein [Nocardia transvalensis]MBB5918641.1 uncharacterized protein (DUF885 family) [Nocardia transvalensis]